MRFKPFIYNSDPSKFLELNFKQIKDRISYLYRTYDDEIRDEVLYRFVLDAYKFILHYKKIARCSFTTYVDNCLQKSFNKAYRHSKAQRRSGACVSLEDWDKLDNTTEILTRLYILFKSLNEIDKKCVSMRAKGYKIEEVRGETGMSVGYISKLFNNFKEELNHV